MDAFLSIKKIKEQLAKKEISSSEILTYYQNRLKRFNQKLNCAIEVFEVDTCADYTSDKQLSGIPCLIKDLICQKGHFASAGSRVLSDYKASYNATVIDRLSASGAVSLGRANCDEFAMGASGETSAYGPTRNPWNNDYVPGGSSSGSAAAVAAGLVPFALGTETGGSIRQPASFCGLVGMYPTYGLHSRYGVIAFGSSLDQVNSLTKTVYDNALVSNVLSGVDKKDATTIQMAPKDYTIGLDGKMPENMTIGIIKDGISEVIDPQVTRAFTQACEQLKKLGAKLKVLDLASLKYGNAAYFIISRAEAASNLSRYDGSIYGHRAKESLTLEQMYINTRQEGFGQEVKTRILTGNYVLSAGHKDAYYHKATQVRSMIRAEFDAAFKDVNLLVCPTVPTLPFKLGQFTGDPVAMFLADCFTVVNCVIGTPAISLPCGYSAEGLPIGFQFFGPRLSEDLLYKVAYAFEQSTDYHLKNPDGYE
jgi:aspartyl-tRNA(Asn)/glutamyl-tRNA(Gln) amidotransferase subunit A